VEAGVVILISNELIARHKFKLNHRCSNNHVEQLAIVKALDLINYLEIADNNPAW
jgi:ribonuclease HI